MALLGRTSVALLILFGCSFSVRVATACSCPPPPPPPPVAQPSLRLPSLNDKDAAVLVGVITEVFPAGVAEYELRWERSYHERLSEQYPLSVGRYREFIFQIWPTLFSPGERDRINSSTNGTDLVSAVDRFWLWPRRISVKVEDSFAGPKTGVFVPYTGLGNGDCGIDFKLGEHWLIDAYVDSAGRWIAHQCSVTLPVDRAKAVLEKLKAKRQ